MTGNLNSKEIPSPEMLSKAAKVELWSEEGKEVSFESIFEEHRTVVVFIRHFFCGQYTSQLESATTPEGLQAANAKVVVIGCGEWKLIGNYKDVTNFKGEMYADPDRALYHALGMTIENLKQTPSREKKRSYLTQSTWETTVGSIWRALHNPSHIGKQGNFSQLGGEFILGPGLECSFASRMQHTEDRTSLRHSNSSRSFHSISQFCICAQMSRSLSYLTVQESIPPWSRSSRRIERLSAQLPVLLR
ncbi:uncharacterized protein STEHIDRAFT_101316 [Stereum hirsutum FP-91666 SS1]|uniref:uncharacterized protein n=1 Tax=Stereum hirsutum (strain FP-91666) TaxID=721885 RepID=UPI00044495E9|nr:uncharacterized protein STEHIDRAFT_101316 [Stereum hirsutum FP-91666 SS1]EIM83212.1 hypothetical protein STEHIDRAFT_101316 [Stereum hirsutum FP-91666 SS1]